MNLLLQSARMVQKEVRFVISQEMMRWEIVLMVSHVCIALMTHGQEYAAETQVSDVGFTKFTFDYYKALID